MSDRERLMALLEECAADLEACVEGDYPPEVRKYPSMQRKYELDMEPVVRARALLAELRGGATIPPAVGS
jgi:hypothetical protein